MNHVRLSVSALIFVFVATLMLAFAPAASAQGAAEEVGFFRTRIMPHVAGVFIDGKYYGVAAMFSHQDQAIPLKPGTYDVRVVDPRYKPLLAKVNVEKGKTSTLRRKMEQKADETDGPFGELVTSGFGNSAVYLNGEYWGNAAEIESAVHILLLKPGKYQVKVEPVGDGTPREEEIMVNADETVVLYQNGAIVRRR